MSDFQQYIASPIGIASCALSVAAVVIFYGKVKSVVDAVLSAVKALFNSSKH